MIVVLADRSRRTYVDDGNMVIANILNAAHAVGVDSCYIYRAREVFNTDEGKELLETWGVHGIMKVSEMLFLVMGCRKESGRRFQERTITSSVCKRRRERSSDLTIYKICIL